MRKKFFKLFGSNLLVFIVGGLLLKAGVNGIISPFFVAFVFALFFQVDNYLGFVFGATLVRASFDFSLMSVLHALNLLVVMMAIKLALKKSKGKLKLIGIFPVCFLGSVLELIVLVGSAEAFVLGTINKVLELTILYSYIVLFRGITVRGTNTKLTLDEMLGLGLMIAPIVLACCKIMVFKWALSSFLVPLVLLFVVFLIGSKAGLVFSIIAGIGASFVTLSFEMLAVWTLFAGAMSLVRGLGRPAMSFAVLVVELMIGFYFKVFESYSYLSLVPLGLAGLVFCLIPRKPMRKLKTLVYSSSKNLAMSEIVMQEERALSDRLQQVSMLFHEMHTIYKSMIMGGLDKSQVEEVIRRDIIKGVCESCPKYKNCHEGRALSNRSLGELIKKGLGKGRVSLVDTPTLLASVCSKTNQIIFDLNARLEEYKAFDLSLKSEDESKIIMSNQLLGVSEILTEFEKTFTFGERAERREEESLISSFLYEDIIVREACIFKKDGILSRIVLVVKNLGYEKTNLERVLTNFFKRKMRMVESRYTAVAGWQVLSFLPSMKYYPLVGISKVAKHRESGDTFANTLVDDKHLLFAISDGIGAGSDANRLSEMTLNLIERFYKAGFSSEHIMDNVNKVMAYKSGEKFCAVDVCVLDLEEGRVDFMKRGGTPSVIKKVNQVVAVEGDNLPIGILADSKGKIVQYYLNSGDVVVIASDGVFDAFGTTNNFAGYINNLPALNMQEFSNRILTRALELYHGETRDDMTVLAVKILLNK